MLKGTVSRDFFDLFFAQNTLSGSLKGIVSRDFGGLQMILMDVCSMKIKLLLMDLAEA